MLRPYFQAIHNLALGEWMRGEVWRVPAVEFLHLMGIVLLFGSILVVNLRLFGLLLRRQPIWQLAEDVSGIQRLGLLLMAISGPILFVTQAIKCYETESFWWKIGFLLAALLFQFTAHRRFLRGTQAEAATPFQARGMAALSLFLWFAVLLNGMWTLLA